MTTDQVFNTIIKAQSWAKTAGFSKQNAFAFKKRYRAGVVKQATLNRLFAKFGYYQDEVTYCVRPANEFDGE